MKPNLLLIFLILLSACVKREEKVESLPPPAIDSITKADSTPEPSSVQAELKSYSNTRFKDVTVEKLTGGKYLIKGKGQIFEANFGWIVEDGHDEIESGNVMTDAGAPEWGNFEFTVEAQKQRENSVLHLVLYETSAKDGSRQFELPIPLN